MSNSSNPSDTCIRTSVSMFRDLIKVNSDKLSNTVLCFKHKKPLEFICLQDKCRICSQCALFGDHKNHDITNEEDILNEVKVRADIYVELFELLESNENSFNQKVFIIEVNFSKGKIGRV